MDRIGKINRRRATGQFDYFALGRKAEHLIRVHLKLDRLEEIFVIFLGIQLLGQLGDPFHRINGKGVPRADTIPIRPMRGHAGFGHVMHLARSDLDFDPFAVTPGNRGMDRPVAVGFGLADVILEPARHRPPASMDDTKCPIAFIIRCGDHAKPIDVGQPRKRLVFLLHLAPDRIRLFGATKDLGLDPRLLKLLAHVAGNPLDHITCFALQRNKAADDRLPPLGVQDAKGQILQLFAHPLHTHAAR